MNSFEVGAEEISMLVSQLKNLSEASFVSGHYFSRAAIQTKSPWALAPV
jgi:hypothetical protein